MGVGVCLVGVHCHVSRAVVAHDENAVVCVAAGVGRVVVWVAGVVVGVGVGLGPVAGLCAGAVVVSASKTSSPLDCK